jgi:hypothetical protein
MQFVYTMRYVHMTCLICTHEFSFIHSIDVFSSMFTAVLARVLPPPPHSLRSAVARTPRGVRRPSSPRRLRSSRLLLLPLLRLALMPRCRVSRVWVVGGGGTPPFLWRRCRVWSRSRSSSELQP